MPSIPAHWRQRQEDFCEGQGQPVLTTKMKGGVGEGEMGEGRKGGRRKKRKTKNPTAKKNH